MTQFEKTYLKLQVFLFVAGIVFEIIKPYLGLPG